MLVLTFCFLPAQAQGQRYASVGSYASYTAEGGFIPFFSGVSGNITYTVTNIYGNGSMRLQVFENITAGTDLQPFIVTLNITDSVSHPMNFPAVPPSDLSTGKIFFQNTSASFYQNGTIAVPAGQFKAMEFQGHNVNGTVDFWFDGATGLALEMDAGAQALQLESSNIATPASVPGAVSAEASYLIVFGSAFLIGGGSFLWLRHHYTKKMPSATPKKVEKS